MITKDMLIADLLKEDNAEVLAEVLTNYGMHCLGCAMAHGETIEQAALVHGIDIDDLMEELLKVNA